MASQWARLAEPPLAVACFYNRVDEVKRLLAGGADVLERIPRNSTPRPPPFNRRRWSPFAGGLAIHVCCYFAHFECLHSLLATGIRGQVDAGFEGMDGIGSTEEDTDVTPLLLLCLRANYQNQFDEHAQYRSPAKAHLANAECVKLLLCQGASLEPVLAHEHVAYTHDGRTLGLPGDDALSIASRARFGLVLVKYLEAHRDLRYSPKTHANFPRPARYAAAELLRLGYQIGGVLAPVWAEHVLPFLVSRTSRGAFLTLPPEVLFIDVLPDNQVEALLDGDHAEHATRELQHRSAFNALSPSDVKAATALAIRDDAALRAAAIEGSLTLRRMLIVVAKRLDLGAGGYARLKATYSQCMKIEKRKAVRELYQEPESLRESIRRLL